MALTSGVTLIPLSAEETRLSGFTHKATVPYSVVVTVGSTNTTATIAIMDVAVGDVVDKFAYAITEAWTDSDASMNSITVSVGDDGDVDRFGVVTGTQLAEDGTEIDYWHAVDVNTAPFAYNTANTVDVVFTVAGGANPTCAELTAGSVDIFLRKFSLTALVDGTA
jgi:hypothetical protein